MSKNTVTKLYFGEFAFAVKIKSVLCLSAFLGRTEAGISLLPLHRCPLHNPIFVGHSLAGDLQRQSRAQNHNHHTCDWHVDQYLGLPDCILF